MPKADTKDDFVRKARLVHPYVNGEPRYGYGSRCKYRNSRTLVEIFCFPCREYFSQRPNDHLNGRGCPRCPPAFSVIAAATFIPRSKEIHCDDNGTPLYNYDACVYINNYTPVKIYCLKCMKYFSQRPNHHLAGHGCPSCPPCLLASNVIAAATFIPRSKEIHCDDNGTPLYNYDACVYINNYTPVKIYCLKCKEYFSQKPKDHLKGHRCPVCAQADHSLIGCQWIEHEAKKRGILIQHARNGGEHRILISGGRLTKVDGYCKALKMVFEFHGTYWHGHPSIFEPDEPHPGFFGMTYGQVYDNTLAREKAIRDAGYTLVVMWEHEWRVICAAAQS